MKQFCTGVALILITGCADISPPDLDMAVALQGDSVLATLDLREADEKAYDIDMPTDVLFELEFTETMTMTSARENIWIEDQDGAEITVDLSARLQTITVTPGEGLGGGQNHTLVVKDDIEDNNGLEMINGYRITFFTAP